MYDRDQLFIGGKWVPPDSGPDSGVAITVISPHSEAVIGHAACAGAADVNRAVDAARAAFDTGPWPRMQPAERIEAITRLAGIYKERRADMAALISAEIGAPITFAKMAQVRLPLTMISAFCGLAANYEWQQDTSGAVRQGHPDCEATGGSRRRGGAVEHAAVPHRLQGRAGAVGRLFGGAQARARVGARRAAARRTGRRSRPSARRPERGARRPRRR